MNILTGHNALTKILLKLLTVIITSFSVSWHNNIVIGQTIGDYQSLASGNWNSGTSWQVYDGSIWQPCAAGDYPGVTAGAGTVYIQNNHTITITADVTFPVGNLRIDGGNQDSYLQFNPGVSLTVTGQTYLNSNSPNDEKAVLVDDGLFTTGSVNANSTAGAGGSPNSRDSYIRISSGTVRVMGDITLNSSQFRTYILFTGNGSLFVHGNITGGIITSNIGGGNSAPASGTVIYNGAIAQTIGDYTYHNLTADNTVGVTLNSNITVNNLLTMIAGNITTGSNTIILSNNSAASLDHISGTIVGTISRAISTTTSVDYLFPVGTASNYRPAIINFSSLSTGINISAGFIPDSPENFIPYSDNGSQLNNAFTEGYWRFSSSGTPASVYTITLTADGFSSYPLDSFARITGRDNANASWRALGTHGSLTGNEISRTGITSLNTSSFDFTLATCQTPIFLGYSYERNISIDHTKVAGGADLYNFPLMISLSDQDFLKTAPAGQVYNPGGYDIIFADEQYNQLDHQLETYNGTNGDLIAWVRIPTLSCSSNTVIKIIYGNPQVTADQSVTSVWDSHYKGVWHLDDNNLDDFTSNDFAGTPYNTPSYPSGVIDNALGLNGSDEYVQVNNNPNINFAGNITVSAWVYMNAGSRDQKIAGNQNNSSGGYKFGIYTNNKVEFEIRNSGNTPSLNRNVAGGTVLSTGQWYYLAGISSDVLDSIKTFVNGIPERPFKKIGTLGIASDNLVIGKEPFQSSYYFNGRFDELRISDKVRSDSWMRTEYFNQVSPSTFYTVDAVGVTTSNLPSEGFCKGPIALSFGYPAGGTYSGNPFIEGDVFTPPSAGTYPITYTYIGGCGPASITKDLIITDIPSAPTAPDKDYCSNQITYLEATNGVNIRWYDQSGNLVSTANPFSTGQTAPGTYSYTVTQTVNGCESTSAEVNLSIFTGLTINSQPQPISICEGDNAVFTFDVDGADLTYQWQEDESDITDGGIYSGANTGTLTLTDPGTLNNGKEYRCVITTTCGTSPVTSSSALLTVTGQVWSGSVSADWNVTGNWACGIIPELTHTVLIPNVTNKPVINSGAPGTVNNITIESGASLTITGNTLQISGSIINDGTLDVSDGTVEFTGSTPQVIGASLFAGNTIKNLTINNSSGVTLQGPLSVTGIVNIQTGNFSSNGFLILSSTASGTALIDGSGSGSVSGNVTMQRYLPSAYGYKYVSSPFQSAAVSEFDDEVDLAAGFPAFYRYNESSATSGWVEYITPTDLLEPLAGYAANFGSTAVSITADITGEVNNGALSVTLYNHNNPYTLGFNLIGNPYPSPINWDAPSGWTKTNIDNALYYFKASTTDEYGGTYSTYASGVSSDGLATAIIPSMQGFFVHVSDGSYPVTGTLGLNNDVRVTDLTHSFMKSEEKDPLPLLRLCAAFDGNISSTDPLVIYFDEKADAGFDRSLDALKLLNTDYYVPSFYSFGTDGTKLSINALPKSSDFRSSIPLGLKTNVDGNIVFRICEAAGEFTGMKVVLTDLVTGSEQDLRNDNDYKAFLPAGEYENRFLLNLESAVTGIHDPPLEDQVITVYSTNGKVIANINLPDGRPGILAIYNIVGQSLLTKKIYNSGYYEFDNNFRDGILLVNLIAGNFKITKKICIKR